jgi:hypothetical protein
VSLQSHDITGMAGFGNPEALEAAGFVAARAYARERTNHRRTIH